jgi:DNA polymerase III epsilon subunit-like protein
MIATVFDTETTGLIINPARNLSTQPEIISIAIQSVNLMTEELDELYFKIFKPVKSINQDITKITGFTNEYVKDMLSIELELPFIIPKLRTGNFIIGQNISFDIGMVEIECKRYNYPPPRWPKAIDLVENSIFLKGYRLSLTNLHQELFGISFSGAHRADVDMQITIKCAIEMFKRGWL